MLPYILLVDGETRGDFYREIRQVFKANWLTKIDLSPEPESGQIVPQRNQIDLALVSDESFSPWATIITELKRQQVPTLHLVDGILEWHKIWDNPRSQSADHGMPLFQPILCHKVACLGRSQARIFESWGNLGKCEIVGAPRFDQLIDRKPRDRQPDQPWRLLIMTAQPPGFTSAQINQTKQSLLDLKQWFEAHPQLNGIKIEPVWHLPKGLDREIGRSSISTQITTPTNLEQVIRSVDAIVTTPATAMLEGMRLGLPVALLDYNNSPQYVPAAWQITAASHIQPVLSGLVTPSPARLLYQDTILHDALECQTPAIDRLVVLMRSMIDHGKQCRAMGRSLRLPDRILSDPQKGYHLPETRLDMQSLYPKHPVFANMDLWALQAEVGHLRQQNQMLQAEIERMQSNQI
ncbi:hypothetical protein Pse7367_0073 [Thalassoporum mexicanum PCC 7367]|uniref:hypothetical protein n=1 Tax=Thalassoporum mexicanum TaxID=3457544 RepID=UPI00029F9083|nr:hypothetical protein [Pseudanabaena sp. PCC 7367]AFY68391.1 hypothetical protein Pse7367_0073 [Pseudanabaena sp. PCC 7367]